MNPDPKGYYARLGVAPSASQAAIVAAFRRHARELHPDVPGTGDVDAFVALKAAYDVLSRPERRAAYDRAARAAAKPIVKPPAVVPELPAAPGFHSRWLALWFGFLILASLAAAWLMKELVDGPFTRFPRVALTTGPSSVAPPPLLPWAQPAGRPTAYVLPGDGAALVWRYGAARRDFLPAARLAPFTPVHVVGDDTRRGFIAIRLADGAPGFVDAHRLTAGDPAAARQAYCAYESGLPPANGEVLARRAAGPARLEIVNRDPEPAVVKLRDGAGRLVTSVFIAPGAVVTLTGLPDGPWRPDFAFGELWSRACGRFAAGERAQRFRRSVSSGATLVIPPDLPPKAMPVDIPDATFAHD